MTLYEIDKAIEDAFYSAVDPDTGEIINDEALEALNELEEARNVKIENIALFIKNLDAEASAIKAEEERLRSRRTTTENRVKWLKDYLNNMLDGEKFKSPRCSVSFRNTKAVNITDAALIPHKYLIPQEPKIDKREISAALKAGEIIDGAELEDRRSIVIK
jgi:hypothetical protein